MSRAAGRWVKHTSEWKDGDRLAGGRNAWLAGRGEMQAVADGGRPRAAKMAKGTLATARMAEDELARLAADAKGLAAEAFGMLSGLDAPDAVAALREEMEAASRAALERRQGAAAGGRHCIAGKAGHRRRPVPCRASRLGVRGRPRRQRGCEAPQPRCLRRALPAPPRRGVPHLGNPCRGLGCPGCRGRHRAQARLLPAAQDAAVRWYGCSLYGAHDDLCRGRYGLGRRLDGRRCRRYRRVDRRCVVLCFHKKLGAQSL